MKAMILAAGFGTRLWPLTIGRTKPAIPFLGRPLIAYTIDYLARFGIRELIVNLHHEPDSVIELIGDGSRYGAAITYSIEEPEILGTAGALDRVRDLLSDDTFLVVNGKIITEIDLAAAMATHRRRGAMATLVLRENAGREHFSAVEVSENGRISRFAGFPDPNALGDSVPLMFTGIHILEPEIFKYIPRGVFSDSVRDIYPAAMAAGELVAGHVGAGAWYELSTLARYLEISLDFLAREGRSVSLGEGCEIAPGARVERSILWREVKVGRGSSLEDCIVGDRVRIEEGRHYRRAALVRAELAASVERPEKALPGRTEGENLVVPF